MGCSRVGDVKAVVIRGSDLSLAEQSIFLTENQMKQFPPTTSKITPKKKTH